MNKKNITKNLLISFLGQIIIIVLGFVLPRIILKNYGSDTNGLTSTITQIFTYLALFEAGISQATKNALFRPINDNDREKMSEIVATSKKQFGRVSLLYGCGVITLAIVLPFILKTDYNYWTIFLIVFFEGLTNSVCFYFINTRSAFLSANGKNYVITSIDVVARVFSYGIKILLALFKVNIVIIQACFFATSLLKLLFYYLYTKKKYPWLKFNSNTTTKKLPDKNSYIVTEIAWTIFSSTDMIVLSIFVSTSLSSVYSVYSMVFMALSGLLNSVYLSINYVLGQTYHKDINEYKKIHDIYNSFFMATITILIGAAYVLIVPFVKIYTKDINDEQYLYKWLPLLFSIIQLLSWSRYLPGNLSGIAGYAKPTSIISMIEAALNIVLSIAFVFFLGINGVLLATVISLPIKVIYLNILSEHTILKRNPLKTILIVFVNFLSFASIVVINEIFGISDNIAPNIPSFLLYGVVIVFVLSMVIFPLNLAVNKDMFCIIKLIRKRNNE